MNSYQRAKRLNPKDPYIFCSLGSACNVLGRPQEAIAYADEALALDPAFAPAMANKAMALKALGRTAEAEILFQKAFALLPELRQHFTTQP